LRFFVRLPLKNKTIVHYMIPSRGTAGGFAQLVDSCDDGEGSTEASEGEEFGGEGTLLVISEGEGTVSTVVPDFDDPPPLHRRTDAANGLNGGSCKHRHGYSSIERGEEKCRV